MNRKGFLWTCIGAPIAAALGIKLVDSHRFTHIFPVVYDLTQENSLNEGIWLYEDNKKAATFCIINGLVIPSSVMEIDLKTAQEIKRDYVK